MSEHISRKWIQWHQILPEHSSSLAGWFCRIVVPGHQVVKPFAFWKVCRVGLDIDVLGSDNTTRASRTTERHSVPWWASQCCRQSWLTIARRCLDGPPSNQSAYSPTPHFLNPKPYCLAATSAAALHMSKEVQETNGNNGKIFPAFPFVACALFGAIEHLVQATITDA